MKDMLKILNIADRRLKMRDPIIAAELAKIANDEMAELVLKYPEKFLAAVVVYR